MAASKSYFARANYRFLDAPSGMKSDGIFELDESDVWSSARSASPEFRKPASGSRISSSRKSATKIDRGGGGGAVGGTAASLPVNVPDWSKILKDEYRDNRRRGSDDDDDFDGDDGQDGRGNRIPPHEFLARQLARTRIASFSVHEGVGRTLKGRDLSRVRNAIWEKTGFED
ncbi:OLC1v1003929C1 [Oldenlandia corymbosa var. corymbosa]|uniref:OLC1v1003929C1 n=1 Tax=Oldenlandia corymbosa var. corymbosa TaxID=529605 RepID=A0AAV1DB26_OLDCO|nr:OLC1v1003929C1 [Oldenlandia corymbosa var. corymbosa]